MEPVEVVDNGDQTHTVNYVPTREGPYSINVLYADEEIPRRLAQAQLHGSSFVSSGSLSQKNKPTPPLQPRSPYKVKVLPTHDASKVRASGPGLNTTGVPASLPVEFTIDAKDAGEGLLAVQITVSVLAAVHALALERCHFGLLRLLTGCVTVDLQGPRGQAQEGQHQGQPRRHLPGVLRARHDW